MSLLVEHVGGRPLANLGELYARSDLLVSMNRRARLQLRLQRTVEGLSVAAVSYYVVGLLYYLFQGAEEAGLLLDATIAAAAAVPPVVVVIWWLVRRIRRKFDD